MKNQIIRIVALLAATAGLGIQASGQTIAVPASINYQGVLADSSGSKIPDGNTNVAFRLYNVAVSGTPLWGPKTNSVAVVGGAFNTLVGGSDRANPARDFGAVLASLAQTPNTAAFLELSVGGTAVVPRQQILSAPYAMLAGNAGKLNGFSWADLLGTENPTTGLLDGGKLKPGSVTLDRLATSPASVLVTEEQLPTRLRIVRGSVDSNGAIRAGSGFTVAVSGSPFFIYTIRYDHPFSGPPAVVVSPDNGSAATVVGRVDNGAGHQDATFIEFHSISNPLGGVGSYVTTPFNFIAIGPQ